MAKCTQCARKFNETHRRADGATIVQTVCVTCQGINRENVFRMRTGRKLAAPEPVYDTERRHVISNVDLALALGARFL